MSEEKERTHDISQGDWESGEDGVDEREVSTLLMPQESLTRT